MVSGLIQSLASLQDQQTESILYGNFQSTRYHRLIPISRQEDNVYFVAWINQLLQRNLRLMQDDDSKKATKIIERGEEAISKYRNRYGDKSYNFYRPKNWFPNGNILSRFGIFQPTDDADDTSIALRGKVHTKEYARSVKKIFEHQSNGLRGRWIKRIPKQYRSFRCYNTWIGSEELYVDVDLVVLCNILMFNNHYNLSFGEEDQASVDLLIHCIKNGDYLKKSWSLSAWYPMASTILYAIADLISCYTLCDLTSIKSIVIRDIRRSVSEQSDLIDVLLLENALLKLGERLESTISNRSYDDVLQASKRYSFGVIPLLHPFNGLGFQFLSRSDIFRMYYRCDAQCVAILIENKLLKGN